ncbi:HYR domain-containing protein [uncultured Draconibacterium sp.]|uniref:HYR domain-containing protein n=1 Tax=uncultured Draconibacterium sp. TaxID=1573823 RepID=UPI002AA889E4|nr:HYR domain-containing protein [uncultured Draconibacterium sp.]
MAVFIGIMDAKSVSWKDSATEELNLFATTELSVQADAAIGMSSIKGLDVPMMPDSSGLVCPDDITTYTDLNSCEALISNGLNILDPENTIASLNWQMTGATDASSGSTGINQINSHLFNEGTTVITYRGATLYNNSIFCTFTVTVSDNQVPRLENPQEDIIVNADAGDCYAFVNWADPLVSDNCASPGQILVSRSYEPGTSFPVGTTVVNYFINDGVEYNTVEHRFLITVVDEEIPEIFAPHDITLNCGDAIPDAFTSWQQFYDAGGMAVDNCNIDFSSFKYEGQQSSGIRCPYTITRTYSISDGEGNVAEIEHVISVGEEAEEEAPFVLKSGMATFTAVQDGPWDDPATWGETVLIPTSADDVFTGAYTVTINANAECMSITIDNSGSLVMSGSNTLSIYGDWINNGTYTAGSGTVEFIGSSDATISGISATAFNALILNKGTDVTTDLTVQSDITITDLTFVNGVLDIQSGTTDIADIVNTSNTIPPTSGLRVSGGILNTGYYSIINEGLIEVTSGTANFGTGSGNSVHTQTDGAFIVSGGEVNIAGRLENTAGGTLAGYPSGLNVSGGTVNLCTEGNGSSGNASLMISEQGAFSFTAGTINFVNPNSNLTDPIDFDIAIVSGSGTKNITNGIFNFEDGSSDTYRISTAIDIPNITSASGTNLEITRLISSDGTYTFSLTDGSGNEIPVTITLSATSYGSNASILVTTTANKHSDNASSSNFLSRYWTITLNDITSPIYSISADYSFSDISGTESEITAGVWTGSLPWTKGNQASGNTISASGITNSGIIFTGITLDAPTVEINGGAASETICSGSSVVLTAVPTGDPGWDYSWTSSPVGFTSSLVNVTVSPTSNTTYTVEVTDGNGFTASDQIAVNVDPTSVGGTASANQTICENSSPSDLTLVGYTGTIQWQWSPDGTSSWTAIGGATGATLTSAQMGSLSAERYYRAEVTSGTCTPDYSGTVAITVDPTSVGGTASANQTICENSSPSDLTLVGYTGTIQWQWSPDGTSSWTAIGGATGATLTSAQMGSLSAERYYRAEVTSGTCTPDYSGTVAITVDPTSVGGAASADQTICENSSPSDLTLVGYTGTIQWQWSPNGTSSWTDIGGATGSTLTSAQMGSLSAERYYRAEVTSGTCTPDYSGTVAITVDPTSVGGTASADQTICENSSPSDLTLVGYTGTIQWQWSPNGTSLWTDIGGATGATLTSAQMGSLSADRYYRAEVTSGICTPDYSSTVAISVTPTVTIDAFSPATSTRCQEAGTVIYTTTANNSTGISYSLDAASLAGGNTINATTGQVTYVAGWSGTTTITASAAGCNGPAITTHVVTIRPTPTATISGDANVCQNESPAPEITFTNPMDLPVTITYTRNLIVQPTIDVPANSSATIAVPVGSATTYNYELEQVEYQTAPSCIVSISGTATVVVNPTPNAGVDLSSQGICSGENITTIHITGTTPGTNFNWERDHAEVTGIATVGAGDISGTLTNPGTSSVTVTFTITPEANGCTGTPITARVTVYPEPVVILSPETQIRCSGEAISSIVPSSTSGGTFTWTRDHVSEVTGVADSGIGAVPTSTVTNTTNAPITVSFIFIPTANGCEGIPDTATVLVNPTPYIIDTSVTICNDGSFDVLPVDGTYGVVPVGTTYEWTVNSTTGGISGAADGSGTSISGTLSNSTNSTQYVTYAVTPYYGSCPRGELFYLTVYVTPEPDIDDLNTEVCSSESFTVIPQNNTNGIVPPGTTYDWVVSSAPSEITGADDGSGTGITDTLYNSSNTNQVVTYTVTPTAGSCIGDPFTVNVTVKPSPAIDDLLAEACSEETFTVTPVDVTDGVVPSGTTYSWSIPIMEDGLTGGSPGSGASTISGTLTNSTDSPLTATYTVTPSVGGCAGEPFEIVVTVNPKPAINPMRDTICSGESFNLAPITVTNGLVPAGTTYSWSAPSVSGVTGTSSGTDEATISGTLTNTTTTVKTVTYTVTPTSGICDGISFSVIITVNPAFSVTDMTATVCSGEAFSIAPVNGVDGSVPDGTLYSWNVPSVPAGITGEAAGNGSSISGTLTNSTNTALTVTYTVDAVAAGCTPSTFDLDVLVNPTPSVSISGSDTVCDNAGSTLVTFTNPTDQPVTATYNINGGFNYTLDIPANDDATVIATISTQGTFHYVLVSAEFQSDPLCSTVLDDTATIVVQPITTASISASATTICYSTPVTFTATVANAGTSPAYQWKINGIDTIGETNLTFTSSTLENGDVVTFTVETFDTPCPATTVSNPVTMTVNDLNIPEVTIYESANPVCNGTSVTFTADPVINGGASPGFEWLVNGATVSTGSNSTYSYVPVDGDEIEVVLTSSASCPGPPDTSNVITMTVDPILPVSVSLAVNTDTVCEGTTVTFTATPANGGLNPIYEWTVDGSTVNISSDSTYTYTPQDGDVVNVELTSSESCASGNPAIATPITITVETPPVASAGGSTTICIDSTYTLSVGEASASNGTILWTENGAGTITAGETTLTPSYTPAAGDEGNLVTLTMTVTSNNSCGTATATANYFINIDPLPTASASGSTTICSNSSAAVSGASATNGTIAWTHDGNGSLVNPTTITPTYIADAADEGNVVTLTMVVTSNNTCGTATDTAYFTVTVESLPTATANGSSTICSDSIFTVPVGAVSATGGTISWSHNGAGSITAGAATETPTYTPAVDDEGNVVTLTMTVTSDNTCGTASATATYPITVETPLIASVSIAADATEVCVGTDITFTATPVNGGESPDYQWYIDGNLVSGETDSTYTTNTLLDGDVVTVVMSPNGTCISGTPTSNPIPVTIVASAPAQPGTIDGLTAICPALSTYYTIVDVTGAVDYTWTVPTGWIIDDGQGTTMISVTIPTGAQSGDVTVIANNVCGSSSAAILPVSVDATGSVYAGPDQVVCEGTTQVTLAGQISGAISKKQDWDWDVSINGQTVKDAISSESDLSATYTFPDGWTTGDLYVVIHSTNSVGGCGILSDTMIITVLPNPTANISSVSPVCEGETTTVTFTATPNTTVTYNIDGGADQTVDIDATGTVTITTATISASTNYNLVRVEYTTLSTCFQALSGSTTIMLYPQPIADAGLDQTICADDSVLLAGSVTDATSYSWSGGTGTFNPDNTTLNTYYIPSAAEILAGSVTLTLTPFNSANSCDSVPDDVVITIDPLPTVEAGGPDTVCQSATPSAIVLSGATFGGGASSAAWSTSDGGTLSSTAQTATPGTVTYTPPVDFTGSITLTLTTDATGTCTAVSDTRIIVVEPVPTVDAGSPDTVCQELTPSAIVLTGANIGGGATSGTWIIVSGGGTLGYTASTTNPDTVTYTPALGYTGNVTLRLTTDIVGKCDAVSATKTITISPAPTVDAGVPQTICADDSVALAGAVGGSATSGTWSGGTGTFNPDNTTLNAYYIPSAAEIAAGTVTLTLTTDDPPGLCTAVSENVQITIDPTVTVNAGANDTICEGSDATLTGTIVGGAGTGIWSGGAGTFNSGSTALNNTYTPTAAEIAAGSVLLTLTSDDPAGACGPESDTTRIVIYREVVITSQPLNTGACVGDSVGLSVVASGSQLTYQWYKDGAPIAGANSADLQFNPVSLTDDASYYVEVSGSSWCSSVTSNTVTLNVDAAITISTQPVSQTECEGADVIFNVIADANGIPLNYQWRKDGIEILGANSSDYYITGISTTDAGDYDVVITGQGNFTCDSTVSLPATLTIGTDGTISEPLNKDTTLCENTALNTISFTLGGSATGVNLSGLLPTGLSLDSLGGGIYTISGTPAETGTFDYTLTTTGSTCINPSVSGSIVVEGQGTISLGGGNDTTSLCIDNPLPTITYIIGGNADSASISAGSLPPGITGSYNSLNGLFTISGTPTAAGTYPYTVTTIGSLCDNPSWSGEITVSEDASINLTSGSDNQTLCIGSAITPLTYTIGGSATSAIISLGSLPAGVSLTQTNDTVYTISGTPTESDTFNFTVSTTGSCLNVSETASIIIEPMPYGGVISPSAFKVCTEINSGTLTLQSYTGNIIRWESSIDAGFTWTQHAITSNTYTYNNLPQFTQFRAVVGNTTCGEVYSDTARVVVIPSFTPEITAIGGDVCSGEPITLTANAFVLPDTVGIIQDGHFNVANPKGWQVYEDGALISPFPASNDNEKIGPWAETNGPKTFCGGHEFEGEKKFALVSGGVNSWMETPIFNLVGMPDAELSFDHAHILTPNATAQIKLSTDGGVTYNILLAEYFGTLTGPMPNVVNDIGIDLSPYLGMTNLRIRFEFDSPDDCSVWAVDNVAIPTPAPDIEYEWGPVYEIPGGSGQTVVVVPPTTTEYTLTVYVAGCPGSATEYLVNVVENPDVITTNTCVGDTATFIAVTGYAGSWSVSGGGSIDNNGLFSADSAGCFEATYTTTSGACYGSASFMVFPQAPIPDVDSGCGPITVTPPPTIDGFDIEYSFDDGATWGPNVPPTADNCDGYHIRTRYITAVLCDSIPIGTVSECSISPEFIRIVDNTPPSFTVPADTTIRLTDVCTYSTDPSYTGNVTDEWDNCPTGLEATYVDVIDSLDCEVLITRYWTLTDNCGNDTSQVQLIRVLDETKPVINPVAQDSTIQCSTTDPDQEPAYVAWLADHAGARATDPCPTTLVWTADTASTSWIGIAGSAQRTVTFTVTDDCGNSDTTSATFYITDDVPPTITCPGSVSEIAAADSCSKTPVTLGLPTYDDDCSIPELTYERVLPDGTTDNGTGTVNALSFPVGTTTVTYIATDNAGLAADCSFTVTIVDTVPPSLTITGCEDVTETFGADECTVIPTSIDSVDYADNCWPKDSLILEFYINGPDGDTAGFGYVNDLEFNVGVSTVYYTVTDPDGNSATCSFTVTILRADIPWTAITCPPALVTYTLGATECETSLTLPPPTIDDYCVTATYTITNDFNNDSVINSEVFPVGTTVVNWIITDNSNNVDTCTVTVEIDGIQLPDITCPPSVTGPMSADECEALPPVLGLPDFEAPCWPDDSLTISYTISSEYGDWDTAGTGFIPTDLEFPVGTNTVWYIVTDPDGNQDSCDFTVTMQQDDISWQVYNCPPDLVTYTLGATECEVSLTLPPPTFNDHCITANYTVTNDFNGDSVINNEIFPVGITEVIWTITDNSGNDTTCLVTVEIDGIQLPDITCPPSVTGPMSADECEALPPVLGLPDFEAPCWDDTALTISYTISSEYGDWDTAGTGFIPTDLEFPVGTNTVWYIVTDPDGNQDSCDFTVTMQQDDISWQVYNCPPDLVTYTLGATECEVSLTLPPPTFNDHCITANYTVTNDFNGDSVINNEIFPVGITEVIWTITDNSGNDTTCLVTVEIDGIQLPTISCPPSVTGPMSADDCEALPPVLGFPDFEAPCWDDTALTISYTISSEYGDWDTAGTGFIPTDLEFPVGTNTVWYIVTDPDGNQDSCDFTVTMQQDDISWQVYTCPPNPDDETVDSFSCDAWVDIDPPTINDHCLTASYSINHNSIYAAGTDSTDASGYYPIGVHTITWTISDNSGNDTTCVQTFEVFDLLPALECPPDVEVFADENELFATNVSVGLPYYWDNCDSVLTYTVTTPDTITTTYNASPDSINLLDYADTYDLGVTTIEYTFKDGNGNVLVCDFTVTVFAAPDIECPPDTTIWLDGTEDDCSVTFDPGVADLIEGAPPITWTYTINFADGSTEGPISYTKDASDPYANPLGDRTFPLGVTTIEWRAENDAGWDTCSHWIEVIDTIPPTFTTAPYENCVDMLHSAVYDPANANPLINHIDPNLAKNPSPDYHTFISGDTSLDLLTLEDNCCDSTEMTINWRIEFTPTPNPLTPAPDITYPDIIGTGQPSIHGANILMPGDGVYFNDVVHHIYYWVTDCNGNTTEEVMEEITITPRPQIIKQY